ncbi:MAG: HNH endonuclease [Candidatus Electrothrix sp. ATG1]|nr:HNH endonuclease [Candidatus Electrothrix sp. ATG1]
MSSNISQQRLTAFKKQSGKCYYCGCIMWLKNPKQFALEHGISKSEASRFQCTGEHLLARCDGGTDEQKNIVAACRFCNSTRHKMKKPLVPAQYKYHIQKRLNKGKWHPQRLRHVLLQQTQ